MNTRNQATVPTELQDLLGDLVNESGDNLRAVIFFGSRLLDTSPSQYSAADMFFVVDDYPRFYRDARDHVAGPKRLMAWLNRLLPPNVIYLPTAAGAGIKGFIISWRGFRRAMGPRARDHFCQGRLSQQIGILHERDEETGREVRALLETGRNRTLQWVPVYAAPTFDAAEFCRTMLTVSYAGEVRPESPGRVNEVFSAQQEALIALYTPVLESGVRDGTLHHEGQRYAASRSPTARDRRRWRWYFAHSKVRATLRWMKYVVTFSGWPDYIAHKLERRTGMHVELTERERRWPWLFAWPRATRTLIALRRQRKQHEPGKEPS